MKRIPAGAGNDDPRRRLRTADGETSLRDRGLSSFFASVTVHKSFSGRRETADIDELNPETSLCDVLAESLPLEASRNYV